MSLPSLNIFLFNEILRTIKNMFPFPGGKEGGFKNVSLFRRSTWLPRVASEPLGDNRPSASSLRSIPWFCCVDPGIGPHLISALSAFWGSLEIISIAPLTPPRVRCDAGMRVTVRNGDLGLLWKLIFVYLVGSFAHSYGWLWKSSMLEPAPTGEEPEFVDRGNVSSNAASQLMVMAVAVLCANKCFCFALTREKRNCWRHQHKSVRLAAATTFDNSRNGRTRTSQQKPCSPFRSFSCIPLWSTVTQLLWWFTDAKCEKCKSFLRCILSSAGRLPTSPSAHESCFGYGNHHRCEGTIV